MPPRTPQHRNLPGRSSPGRIHLLDRYLALAEPKLLGRSDGLWAGAACADIGLGERADTTAEWAAWLRARWAGLEVLGIDSAGWRIDLARAQCGGPGLRYVQGSFAPPTPEPLRLVRAINLLRGYPAEESPAAWLAMGRDLLPGGLLVEGSTDQPGAVLVAHLLRRTPQGLTHEGLLFGTDLSRGFAPAMFRGPLPSQLRGGNALGLQARAFLYRWTQAWEPTRDRRTPGARMTASALALALADEAADASPDLLNQGLLVWRSPALREAFSLALPLESP